MKQETEVNFDTNNIQSVKLNLLNGQVDIILRALELYSYTLEYMLNGENSPEEERQEKLAMLKYTFEQVLATQAEQVNGKSNNTENLSIYGKKMVNDTNIINLIPKNNKNYSVG